MKKILLLLIFFLQWIAALQATTYTFSGHGNWKDTTQWSPAYPPLWLQTDTIKIMGHCTIASSDSITLYQQLSGVVMIQDTLTNLGTWISGVPIINLATAYLVNYGMIEIRGQHANGFLNYGHLAIYDRMYYGGLTDTFNNMGDLQLHHAVLDWHGPIVNHGLIRMKNSSMTTDSTQQITNYASYFYYGNNRINNYHTYGQNIWWTYENMSIADTVTYEKNCFIQGYQQLSMYVDSVHDIIQFHQVPVNQLASPLNWMIELHTFFNPQLYLDTFNIIVNDSFTASLNNPQYDLRNLELIIFTGFPLKSSRDGGIYIPIMFKEKNRIYVVFDKFFPIAPYIQQIQVTASQHIHTIATQMYLEKGLYNVQLSVSTDKTHFIPLESAVIYASEAQTLPHVFYHFDSIQHDVMYKVELTDIAGKIYDQAFDELKFTPPSTTTCYFQYQNLYVQVSEPTPVLVYSVQGACVAKFLAQPTQMLYNLPFLTGGQYIVLVGDQRFQVYYSNF